MEAVRDTKVTEKRNVRNSDDYSPLECDAVFSGRSMLSLIAICNIASGHIHNHHRENNFWGPCSCLIPLIHNTFFLYFLLYYPEDGESVFIRNIRIPESKIPYSHCC